jgi:antitoxin component YwqK of YwqJK toxin-antitoxin module
MVELRRNYYYGGIWVYWECQYVHKYIRHGYIKHYAIGGNLQQISYYDNGTIEGEEIDYEY